MSRNEEVERLTDELDEQLGHVFMNVSYDMEVIVAALRALADKWEAEDEEIDEAIGAYVNR